jgi:hypothetical protein
MRARVDAAVKGPSEMKGGPPPRGICSSPKTPEESPGRLFGRRAGELGTPGGYELVAMCSTIEGSSRPKG